MGDRLAALRVLIGAYACGYTALRLRELWAIAHLPAAHFEGTGLAQFTLPPAVVLGLGLATAALCGALAVGWRLRAVAPAAALLLAWTFSYRSAWGQVFHTENLMVLQVAALAIAAWLDDPEEALRLLAALTVLTYVMAGIAKLRLAGLAWLDGDQLRNQIAVDNLRKALLGGSTAPLATVLLDHPAVFSPLSIATLVVELGAPLALLGRRAAVAWVTVAWAFHVGVLLTMWILFPYPLLGVAFLPLLPVERGIAWVRRRYRNGLPS